MLAVSGILTAAGGCDKQASGAPAVRPTSLAGRPAILYLLFGDKADPRLLPVATVANGRVGSLSLDSAGWHAFDKLYFEPGGAVTVYRDGAPLPEASIRRGMWSDAEPLYKLPGCHALRPLAAVSLKADPALPPTLEFLATSTAMAQATRTVPTQADQDSARAFAGRAAQRAGLTRSGRDELELVTQAIHTGATDRPTLVIAYNEKGSGGGAHPRHVFAIADLGIDSYASTFAHAASDSAPEFRRLIDHVDLTGDGVDEIVLEGWHQGGESFLVILQFTGGRWQEVARGTNSWCADVKIDR
jgi:hypothetical protein